MTANVHQLRHLVYFVRLFGPLWVYSCFGFENMNGCLTSMIHGTRHIAEQVIYSNNLLLFKHTILREFKKDNINRFDYASRLIMAK